MASQPMSPETEAWFIAAFPFLFVGMWLLVTTFLGFLSGWFSLQAYYADEGTEPPLLTLRWQSGSMGIGVDFGNCLTLAAKPKGLSIRLWRIFGLFQRPLLVPWHAITVKPTRMLFMKMVRLDLGGSGSLKISEKSWNRLVAAAGPFANAVERPLAP